MKVLLVSVNSKYVHSSLAIWYLASALTQSGIHGVSCEVLEATINQPEKDVLSDIIGRKPDILAFSCYIWNIQTIKKLIPQITAALPQSVIVLGGPEVSYNSSECFYLLPEIWYIIAGEGEYPFSMLIRCLQSGNTTADIPGLCFRGIGGSILCNPPATPPPDPPSPYTEEYMQSQKGRIAYLETSRGCPFSCAFCLSGQNGNHVRFFDLETAKSNLLLLANSGAQTVKLVDRTFNCNPGRAYELFSFIIQNAGKAIPKGICFHFEVAADLFDEKTLTLLASAPPGLIQLEAGLQSFHLETLAAVNRKTDLYHLQQSIRTILRAQNIHLHIDLIAGLPYENLACFADSFNRAYALSPHMLQLGFLKMLHGSRLRSQAESFGYSYSVQAPYTIRSSPWLSKEDIQTLCQTEYALGRLYNSGRFPLALAYLLQTTTLSPFAFFTLLGKHCSDQNDAHGSSLDAFTQRVYSYCAALDGVDPAILRDRLVCDRIASDNTGRIPEFLKVPDSRYKKAVNTIKNLPGNKNKKIGAALLYTGNNTAVYADYTNKDPVSGRYPVTVLKDDFFDK